MKAIDILLVNPKNRKIKPAFIPYGILYIASYLKGKGINVRIYDRNAQDYPFEEALKKRKPKIVGFSVFSGPTILDAIDMSIKVKENLKGTYVIWGGIHPSIFPHQCLRKEYIDIVVSGEGEVTAYEIVKKLIDNKGPEDIRGVFYKKNGGVLSTGERGLISDLDSEIPLPAWELLDMKQYIISRFYARRVITYNTSRGCVFRCTFCHNPHNYNKRQWRGFSAKRVFDGISQLKEHYGIKGIDFFEDDFTNDKKRVVELAGLLIKNKMNIKWAKTSRVNWVDYERLKKEYESGLRNVDYGVESGSDRVLKFIKKDQTKRMIKRGFDICHKIGIKVNALFILGLPTETKEEFRESRDFIKGLKPYIFMPSFFKPYPGSDLYDYCIKYEGFKEPRSLEEVGKTYGFQDSKSINMSNVPMEEMLEFDSYCVYKNLQHELWQAIKTFNIKYIKHGFNFFIKRKLYRRILDMHFFKKLLAR